MPTVNVDATNKHLAEITKGVAAEAIAVLVIDGAGWYRSSTLIVLDNIVLLTLPPIGPILSVPSEHVNGQRSEIRRVGITASQAARMGRPLLASQNNRQSDRNGRTAVRTGRR